MKRVGAILLCLCIIINIIFLNSMNVMASSWVEINLPESTNYDSEKMLNFEWEGEAYYYNINLSRKNGSDMLFDCETKDECYSIPWGSLDKGEYKFTVTAYDSYDYECGLDSVEFTIDMSDSFFDIQIDNLEEDEIIDNEYTFEWKGDGNIDCYEVSIKDIENDEYMLKNHKTSKQYLNYDLSGGEYYILVKAFCEGEKKSDKVYFKVKGTEPKYVELEDIRDEYKEGDTVYLEWSSNADKFEVEFRNETEDKLIRRTEDVSRNEFEIEVGDVDQTTEYSFRVSTTEGNKASDKVYFKVKGTEPKYVELEDIRDEYKEGDTVYLEWSSNADEFEVEFRNETEDKLIRRTEDVSRNEFEIEVGDVDQTTEYSFRVSTTEGNKASDKVYFKVKGTEPKYVELEDIRDEYKEGDTVYLEWSSNADEFEVEFRNETEDKLIRRTEDVSRNEFEIEVGDVDQTTEYSFRVSTTEGNKASDKVYFKVKGTEPKYVELEDIRDEYKEGDTVYLEWSSNADEFEVEFRNETEDKLIRRTEDVSRNEFEIEVGDVDQTTEYSFRVSTTEGNKASDKVYFKVKGTEPKYVELEDIRDEYKEGDTVYLEWSSNADEFEVEFRNETEDKLIRRTEDVSRNEFEIEVGDVDQTTEYSFRVSTTEGNKASDKVYFKVKGTEPKYVELEDIRDEYKEGDTVYLEWSSNADEFEVEFRNETKDELIKTDTTISKHSKIKIPKNSKKTKYSFVVYVIENDKKIKRDKIYFDVSSSIPEKPTRVIAKATENTITISWSKVDSAINYDVSLNGDVRNTKETSYTYKNLQPSKNYDYAVRAQNDSGKSKYSKPKIIKTKSEGEEKQIEHEIVLKLDNPYMYVDGEKVLIDKNGKVSPKVQNRISFVPIRSIIEALGGSINWNGKEEKTTINLDGRVLELWTKKDYIKLNGVKIDTGITPLIENDRTLLPIRVVSENLGCSVKWIGSERKIVIEYNSFIDEDANNKSKLIQFEEFFKSAVEFEKSKFKNLNTFWLGRKKYYEMVNCVEIVKNENVYPVEKLYIFVDSNNNIVTDKETINKLTRIRFAKRLYESELLSKETLKQRIENCTENFNTVVSIRGDEENLKEFWGAVASFGLRQKEISQMPISDRLKKKLDNKLYEKMRDSHIDSQFRKELMGIIEDLYDSANIDELNKMLELFLEYPIETIGLMNITSAKIYYQQILDSEFNICKYEDTIKLLETYDKANEHNHYGFYLIYNSVYKEHTEPSIISTTLSALKRGLNGALNVMTNASGSLKKVKYVGYVGETLETGIEYVNLNNLNKEYEPYSFTSMTATDSLTIDYYSILYYDINSKYSEYIWNNGGKEIYNEIYENLKKSVNDELLKYFKE